MGTVTDVLTIVVLAKHAVDPETMVVDEFNGQPDARRLGFSPDPASLRAAAWALAASRSLAAAGHQCRVVAVVAGPAEADDTARHLLAIGADEAVRADISLLAHDPLATARALALAAPIDGSVALVVAGAASVDRGSGVVPPAFAELVGLPFVGDVAVGAPAVALEAPGSAPASGSVTLSVLDVVGRRVEVRVGLPAVLGIRGADVPLLAPTLERRLAASEAAIRVVRVAVPEHHARSASYCSPTVAPHLKAAPVGDRPDERIASLMSSGAATRSGQVLRGSVETLVDGAVAFLVTEGFVGRDDKPTETDR